MSSKSYVRNTNENENMCVVCFKTVHIYSVGICDHAVCYECSTRMRVLCRQNECPICRQDMPKVIFCDKVQPFRNLKMINMNTQLVDRKFGIWFETIDIQRSYNRLLEHNCSKCNQKIPFRNFNQLKDHMRREHELYYCELCVENLRIFTWERKCYTRSELAQHRRKGDADNTSHRGHPLCEFCDTRYMDSDELFRHLRRDHLFCHFCDADGLHLYYSTYEDLRQHFETEHYLCEEGDCINEKFTSVFRSDIDLKAHRASVHGKYLGKAASKQARTLELEFTLAPRPRPEQSAIRTGRKPINERVQEEGAVGFDSTYTEPVVSRGITLTAQDFPSLGKGGTGSGSGSASAPPSRLPGGNVTIRHITRSGGQNNLARTDENFPALSSDASTVRFSVNSTVVPQEHNQSTISSGNNSNRNHTPNVSIQFNHRPSVAITTHISQNASGATNSVRVRPPPCPDAFPALTSVTTVPEAQWVKQQVPVKEPVKPKASKVAAAPMLPFRDSPTDFPSLNKTEIKPKKSTTVTMQVEQPDQKDQKSKPKNKKKLKNSSETIIKTTSASNVPAKEQQQNGVVKKRSELRIDSLHIDDPNPGTSNGHHDDFPVLNRNKPPPGFVIQAPPGFAANDLTFTNSSGQSYSILPTEQQQFTPPPNFQQRNKKIVESFVACLESNEAILQFKDLSGMFRNGLYPADKYYKHCKSVMRNDFPKIFPELLVLLPNIVKQQELYALHCKDANSKRGIEVCAICKQVVASNDLRSHLTVHNLETHFPVLGSQEIQSVWKK